MVERVDFWTVGAQGGVCGVERKRRVLWEFVSTLRRESRWGAGGRVFLGRVG